MGYLGRFLVTFKAFWILGLLNNFLWVVMNAGAGSINEALVGLVMAVTHGICKSTRPQCHNDLPEMMG